MLFCPPVRPPAPPSPPQDIQPQLHRSQAGNNKRRGTDEEGRHRKGPLACSQGTEEPWPSRLCCCRTRHELEGRTHPRLSGFNPPKTTRDPCRAECKCSSITEMIFTSIGGKQFTQVLMKRDRNGDTKIHGMKPQSAASVLHLFCFHFAH